MGTDRLFHRRDSAPTSRSMGATQNNGSIMRMDGLQLSEIQNFDHSGNAIPNFTAHSEERERSSLFSRLASGMSRGSTSRSLVWRDMSLSEADSHNLEDVSGGQLAIIQDWEPGMYDSLTDSLGSTFSDMALEKVHTPSRRLRLSQFFATGNVDYEQEEENVCCICLESYSGSDVVQGSCSHQFHLPCLTKWKLRSALCPLCCGDTLQGVGDTEEVGAKTPLRSRGSLAEDEEFARILQRRYARQARARHARRRGDSRRRRRHASRSRVTGSREAHDDSTTVVTQSVHGPPPHLTSRDARVARGGGGRRPAGEQESHTNRKEKPRRKTHRVAPAGGDAVTLDAPAASQAPRGKCFCTVFRKLLRLS